MSKNEQKNPSIIRVAISEAARLFGINARTIRRAIAEKAIKYVIVRGRYKIDFESLVAWSQEKATVRKKRDRDGIGQFVERWKIRNEIMSPTPDEISREKNK